MKKLLLRLMLKNNENTSEQSVHSRIGKMTGYVGVICNIVLFFCKIAVGYSIGSVSVIADAINNLSDVSSSLITLFGFRLSQRPADNEHPYGHARYEYLSGLVVSVIILFAGVELIKASVAKLIDPKPIEFSVAAIAVLIIAVLVKLWMYRFYVFFGKYIKSSTLKATAADSRNDAIATSVVLLGALASRFLNWNIDGYVGLAVGLFILYSGINIVKETVSPLLGKKADKQLVEDIQNAILSDENILGIHDLLVHDYGPGKCYASVHAEFNAKENLLFCHEIIDSIESYVLETLNVNLVIHIDPVMIDDCEWKEIKEYIIEIINKIDPNLSMHDFHLVKCVPQPKLIFDLAVPYRMRDKRNEIKQKIDEIMLIDGKHYSTVIRFDEKE